MAQLFLCSPVVSYEDVLGFVARGPRLAVQLLANKVLLQQLHTTAPHRYTVLVAGGCQRQLNIMVRQTMVVLQGALQTMVANYHQSCKIGKLAALVQQLTELR
jgi:hypothetical protein